jgi:3-dehydroquinate synthase
MINLTVDLAERSYPIFIGQKLLDNPDVLLPYISGKQVLIVSNTTVAPLYLKRVKALLTSKSVFKIILPDGEKYKNQDTLNTIYDALLSNRLDRSCTLIALGGGVVGDITGFAAASYQRGVNFIQIPTTLLSQVDSSVGGKTGINHPLGKNMVGAFKQPKCVIADTDTLSTLPRRELSAGFAEVAKYGFLHDEHFITWLENNVDKIFKLDARALAYAVKKSCQAKADIVAADEFESANRALLNLGHTFGHAIETQMGYGNWLHGEGVAAGMCMAARMSAILNMISDNDVKRIEKLLERALLPISPPHNMTKAQFIKTMSVDKKVKDNIITLILIKQLGKAIISSDYSSQSFNDLFTYYRL